MFNNKGKKLILVLLAATLAALCCACVTDISDVPADSTDTDAQTTVTTYFDTAISDTEEVTTDNGEDTTTDSVTTVTDKVTDKITDKVTDAQTEEDTDEREPQNTRDPDREPPSPEADLRLIMVGDILMHDAVIESGLGEDGKYDYSHLFENISEMLESSNVKIANQEVIIAGEKYGISGYPRFNSPLALADALADAGFNVIAHATNHTLDKGADAMLECLSYWRTEYPSVSVVGMHDSKKDAEKITLVEENGIVLAILNYTYGVNYAGDDDIEASPYLVDILKESRVRADIRIAEQIADATVVAVHWGTEYTHEYSSTQKKWANVFLEEGVELVLGTHPHVIQPIEWMEGKGGRRMLVYWSLGNFVNCTSESGKGKGARMLGAMADVLFAVDDDSRVYIESASAHPLITHLDYSRYGITTYLFDEYTEQLFSENKAKEKDASFTYEYCVDTFDDILGDFWMRTEVDG